MRGLRWFMLSAGMVICLAVSVISAPARVQKISDGLVGYWPLDEDAGDSSEDMSGNGNDGQITGNVEWVEGKFGSALEFFGSGGSTFIVQDSESLRITGDLTIEAWIYPTAKPQKGGIITKYKGAGDNRGYMIDFYDTHFRTSLSTDGRSATNTIVGTHDWEADTWYHVATVFDGSNVHFYVNGQLIQKSAKSDGINPTTSPLELGNSWEELVFSGIIDEARVWDVARTEKEIQTLMTGPDAMAVDAAGKLAVAWGELRVK
ncbi:LamG domain-containing protein [Candidatus Poribacteria bacterium]